MSLDFAERIMAMNLDPDHKNFSRLLGIQQSIASSMLTATARVRDGLLRPSNDDGLADLLKALNAPSEADAIAELMN